MHAQKKLAASASTISVVKNVSFLYKHTHRKQQISMEIQLLKKKLLINVTRKTRSLTVINQ